MILNRDGRAHLERCLTAIAKTAYQEVEIIVVDNASTDGSAEMAEHVQTRFPLKVIRNEENRSFSEANGQGVAAGTGELICFLNNDVDPITEHWLGYMVETLSSEGAAAVGARLIYPRHRGGPRAGSQHADLTLQHDGVEFDRTKAIPMPSVMGSGGNPLSPEAAMIDERPALTAACLLVSRSAFEGVDGFALPYDYGIEDIDLCLKLRAAGGRLIYDGRAAMWHHESATRAADVALYRARVKGNREIFADTWGPRIFREALLDGIAGAGRMSNKPFHVAITITSDDPVAGFGDWYTGHELGDALNALGWQVSYLSRSNDGWYVPDASVEAVIVLLDACDIRKLPRRLITMAWIRNWPERWMERVWFDDFDVVFGSSDRIVAMVRERSAKVATLLPLATNPARFGAPSPDANLVCDVLFAGSYWGEDRDVVDALPALAERGISVHVHGRGWSDVPTFAGLDRGYLPYEDVPRAYASARIVVDEAASSTKTCASVNSRVFDALAAGAVVISSGATGVHDLFGDLVPTWTDSTSLISHVESILSAPHEATRRSQAAQAAVLAEHTYAIRAVTIRDALTQWAMSDRYGLRIGVPRWDVFERWGDYHFARALQRSLERLGHPTRVHFLPDWKSHVSAREDITIHLFGLKEAPTRSGQVNLLWQISHPDLASAELYDRYDHAFVASDRFAARMAGKSHVPTTPLHQATDPARFKPDPTGPGHELLFVANSRHVRRPIVDDLANTTHDLAVYGMGWTPELIDPRFVKGENIPNADVHRYYSSAAIVLNDHWDDMRIEGFLSNRLYDALASGAFVVSDDVEGLAAEFGGTVATYRSQPELNAIIEAALADPDERSRRGVRGRDIVIRHHTFDARAAVIHDVAHGISSSRPRRILD
ncbi:MAG: glycosyltransferase [Chloroflexi bacterium]|nr:glycosyltransferase [Chloroflexota bacterium]